MRAITATSIMFLLCCVGSASAQQRPLGFVEGDRVRITAHLTEVEAELRAADVSHLTDAQRAARLRGIDRLHDYRVRGEFPHGREGQPGPRVPTFIDADGRACAMGHLVIESGAADVAREIAESQNHARVPEIEHPALAGWLAANGMTLEEAARVQPSYCWEECPDAGMQAVCGSDGYAYMNACIAECEGVSIVGPATCTGGSCTCPDGAVADDAGAPREDAAIADIDAGADRSDAGTVVPRLDGGGGGTVAPTGGCAVDHGQSPGVWCFAALAMLVLARRRRR
jgi:hypothetical protein